MSEEVQPLGSKQSLSNGNEPEELTELLCAFGRQNHCLVAVTANVVERKGKPTVVLTASALPVAFPTPAHRDLDSASVQVWLCDYKTLMGAFSRLLYALDFKLAEAEWGDALGSSA